jgi:hypothetical protein
MMRHDTVALRGHTWNSESLKAMMHHIAAAGVVAYTLHPCAGTMNCVEAFESLDWPHKGVGYYDTDTQLKGGHMQSDISCIF